MGIFRVLGEFGVFHNRAPFSWDREVFEVKTVLGDGTAVQSAHNPAGKPDSKQLWICSFGCFTGISRNPLTSSEKERVRPMALFFPRLVLSFGL